MTAIRQSISPQIQSVGLTGMIVRFSDVLSDAHNRAALSFGDMVAQENIKGVAEVSTTLTSVFLRFDPAEIRHDALHGVLQNLLAARDWTDVPLPKARKFWRVPTVYGTDLAPQFPVVADFAGMSEAAAIETLGSTRVRVLTIGFGPGQPYLGPLGEKWDIPRQSDLTPQVPAGALVLAVSQFVLFTTPSPTGWRHVGQTGFHGFAPERDVPFRLRAGDEMQFFPVSKTELRRLCESDPETGGAIVEEISQ